MADADAVEPVRFTDGELAFPRFARFGELPARVVPAEWVEVVETEQPELPARHRYDPGRDNTYWPAAWF